MDRKVYQSALMQAIFSRQVLLAISGILLIGNLLLSIALATADRDVTTVVTPPDFQRPFTIKGNEISNEYAEQISRYFIGLLMTYTPDTAESQFNIVRSFIHPSAFGAMRNEFAIEVDNIRSRGISSVFHVVRIHVKGNTAFVTGEQQAFIGSRALDPKTKTYEFNYSFDNGQLYITGYSEANDKKEGA